MDIYILFAAATAAAALATKLTKDYAARTQLLDMPTERSSHIRPVPRGGGAGFVAVILLAVLVLAACGYFPLNEALALSVGGAAVALIGWMDDRRSRPAALRFAVHCAAAIWVLAWIGVPADTLTLPDYPVLWSAFAAVFFLAITWLINSYNFMDGIDGIAVGEAVAVGLPAAVLCESNGAALLCCITAAGALGFLPWNWPRAKIFMGDVGSGFLGFVFAIAWLAETRANPEGFFTIPVLLGCFIADATTTLFWRMAKGEQWYAAHKLHVYQTYARVYSHQAVTLTCIAVTVGWLAPFAWLAKTHPASGLLVAVAAYAPLAGFVVFTHLTKTPFPDRGTGA